MKARLARLEAELTHDLPTIARLALEIATSPSAEDSEAQRALVAVRIHRYYTAVETTLERIERTFAAAPTGPDWHRELLEGAALELPGVRPAILSSATVSGAGR